MKTKKPSGKIRVFYRSGREELLPLKTYEGKDYNELVKDLKKSHETGATIKHEVIFDKASK